MGLETLIESIKSFFDRRATREPPVPAGRRGMPVWHKDHCIHCMQCARVCPTGACWADSAKAIHVDYALCIYCGSCEFYCPTKPKSITLSPELKLIDNADPEVRDAQTDSSVSGGDAKRTN